MKQSLIAIAIVTILASCGGTKKSTDKTAELATLKTEQSKLKEKIAAIEAEAGKKDTVLPTPVEVFSATPSIFINYIDVQGKVDAENNQVATPEMPGVIQAIYVHTGQFVNKGQVVATLKANVFNDGMAELDQQISFAKTLYDKQKRLWDQEIGTEVQLLAAKNNYDALLRKRTTLTTQKTMYNIVAPISGVVDAVDIKQGNMVSPGMPIGIRIVSNSNLKVKADIAENYGSRVNGGDQVMLIFPDLADTIITRIGYVTKVINPISRTFTAEIPVAQNGRLRPNMVVKARIVGYRNDRAFVVPAGIIQKIDGQDYLFIMDVTGKAKLQSITIGESYLGKVEVLSGIVLGDKIITNGYADLNEGDVVAISEQ